MLEWLEAASNRVLWFNPCVLAHDLRLRMRTKSVFVLMFVFVLICGVAAGVPFVHWALMQMAGTAHETREEIGRVGLGTLGFTLLTLLLLALPAWAATGIAGERERDTLAVLRSTMLTAADVAFGKFAATVTYSALLLAVSLPVAAWCIMLGAVAPAEVAMIYLILLSFAVGVAGIGTWMSALCRSVITAVVSTYIVLIGLFGGVLLVAALQHEFRGVTLEIIGMLVVAVVWIGPAAITAWAIAALVRWIVMRTGRLASEKAQATFAVAIFGIVMVAIAGLQEALGVLIGTEMSDLALINPYFALVEYMEDSQGPWAAIWTCGALAAAGCMGATRCLRLREFRPVYVTDIFISAWDRVRASRTATVDT